MSTNGVKPTLRIYVAQHCWSFDEAMRLSAEVQRCYNQLVVEVINLEAEGSVNRDDVFSTPTYVLEGHTISLGNPSTEELFAKLSALLEVSKT